MACKVATSKATGGLVVWRGDAGGAHLGAGKRRGAHRSALSAVAVVRLRLLAAAPLAALILPFLATSALSCVGDCERSSDSSSSAARRVHGAGRSRLRRLELISPSLQKTLALLTDAVIMVPWKPRQLTTRAPGVASRRSISWSRAAVGCGRQWPAAATAAIGCRVERPCRTTRLLFCCPPAALPQRVGRRRAA